eukprot:1702410-Pyramimonas_sp.AAC.1
MTLRKLHKRCVKNQATVALRGDTTLALLAMCQSQAAVTFCYDTILASQALGQTQAKNPRKSKHSPTCHGVMSHPGVPNTTP